MIPYLLKSGKRILPPNLIGFGRSDKPADKKDHTYRNHVEWMKSFLRNLDLKNITLVCQDWGSLIGLRLVAEESNRFAPVALARSEYIR